MQTFIPLLFSGLCLAAAIASPLLQESTEAAPKVAVESPAEAVAPGLVAWHPDRAAALAAARTSGRPVLLFQMLGRLDERFC
ncbi:MAG: hypothetical protein P1V81_04990 [Planctomycetota bacterium]|nr:hypothetical protein [Planctomycetota bacterium]